MDVSIKASELRDFASAVGCLGRVGAELSLVASEQALHIRALNAAKSAFMAFKFANFDDFEATEFSCTILAKPVASCLKNLRSVARLRIYLEDDSSPEPHLVFQLISANGVVRCHRLTIGDGEVLHAVFDDSGCSRLVGPPVTFSNLLEHIHGTDELVATVLPTSLKLKSFHNPNLADRKGRLQKALQTEMSIAHGEFDEYEYLGPEEGMQLVFCFREVRALMSFCDAVEADHLSMQFHRGGKPLQFAAQKEGLEIELIMSTMHPRTGSAPPESGRADEEKDNDDPDA